jgi:hypothetical protein
MRSATWKPTFPRSLDQPSAAERWTFYRVARSAMCQLGWELDANLEHQMVKILANGMQRQQISST